MRKTGLFLASIALSATLWAELPEKKGLDVINRANAEAYIGFLASDAVETRCSSEVVDEQHLGEDRG